MKDIVEFCGYTSAYSLLNDHMTTAELTDLLESLVDSPEDAVDFVKEEVVRIAKDIFEWVDRDDLIAKAEDMAYAKYRDGE
tara:strand:+ start:2300 stop:2542 length:243 start_codon:yes stop_codon:yes gene_type:complete